MDLFSPKANVFDLTSNFYACLNILLIGVYTYSKSNSTTSEHDRIIMIWCLKMHGKMYSIPSHYLVKLLNIQSKTLQV